MENKATNFVRATKQLIDRSREFFAFDAPTAIMPASQLTQFAAQAHVKHYLIAVFFAGETTPMVGHLTRKMGTDRFLLQGYRNNVYRVVNLAQLTYLKRV